MSEPLYQVTQKEIDTLIRDLNNAADLSPDNAIDPKLIAEFTCLICSNVVKDMVECSNCNHFFCNVCINAWTGQKKNVPCPHCQRQPFAPAPRINPLLVAMLNEALFECKRCSKQFKYKDFKAHLMECNE